LSYLGILVGLACLGKYHGFALGFRVGFLFKSPRHRSALLSPWAWLGLGLICRNYLPNFVLEYSMIGSIRFQSELVPRVG